MNWKCLWRSFFDTYCYGILLVVLVGIHALAWWLGDTFLPGEEGARGPLGVLILWVSLGIVTTLSAWREKYIRCKHDCS